MGLSTFPAVASSIKSVQRGTAVSAGNITISAVKIAKTMVNSFGTSSAGTVAATGTVAAASGASSGISFSAAYGSMIIGTTLAYNNGWVINSGWTEYYFNGSNQNFNVRYGAGVGYNASNAVYNAAVQSSHNQYLSAMNTNGANISMNSQAISGGTTDLTSASYGAYLSDATTLVVTGPCRYEVIEYY